MVATTPAGAGRHATQAEPVRQTERLERIPVTLHGQLPEAGISLCGGKLRIRSVVAQSKERARLEEFIRSAFRAHFQARVAGFMPELLGVYDERRKLLAAVGLRSADDGPLFLEQYLNQPVERALAQHFRRPVSRASIVEIGNLATTRPGIARTLFQALVMILQERGARWATFTGTQQVLGVFRRLGLPADPLCSADPSKLGAAADDWGSYYGHDPQVAVGDVCAAQGSVDPNLFDSIASASNQEAPES